MKEENRKIKINLKTAVILIIIMAIIVITAAYFISKLIINIYYFKNGTTLDLKEYAVSDTISIEKYNNTDYYIMKDSYRGEYDIQYVNFSQYFDSNYDVKSKFEKNEIMSFNQYMSFCNKWKVEQKYTDTTKNYIIVSYVANGSTSIEANLAAVEYKNGDANIYVWDDAYGGAADISAYTIIIPTDKQVTDLNIIPVYTNEEITNIKLYGSSEGEVLTAYKPIIYLYPIEETEVTVQLLKANSITTSYPKYEESWKVLAKPDGELRYLKSGRELYALYYESENNIKIDVQKDGFVVKGEGVAEFLEEKLAILGLNPRETEEFIIYWLPKLESNKYNYIRFATEEEIYRNMPLEINPNPDSLIRVLMTYKGLEEPIEVEEQKLVTPERKGFVVVEWGGTEIK